MTEVIFRAKGQDNADRLIAIVSLGLIQAIRLGRFSIDEASNQLFWPWAIDLLEQLGGSPDVIQMLDQGRELEDVASLIPQSLPRALDGVEASALSILERTGTQPYDERERWLQPASEC